MDSLRRKRPPGLVLLTVIVALLGIGCASASSSVQSDQNGSPQTVTAAPQPESSTDSGQDTPEAEEQAAPPAAEAASDRPVGSGVGDQAPEFIGITNWINSEPLTLAELRGKVVLLDVWTYTCVNCIRTFPFLRE